MLILRIQNLYSICRGNEAASLSLIDSDLYVFITKLLDHVFNMLSVFVRRWGIQTYVHRIFIPQRYLHKLWRSFVLRVDALYLPYQKIVYSNETFIVCHTGLLYIVYAFFVWVPGRFPGTRRSILVILGCRFHVLLSCSCWVFLTCELGVALQVTNVYTPPTINIPCHNYGYKGKPGCQIMNASEQVNQWDITASPDYLVTWLLRHMTSAYNCCREHFRGRVIPWIVNLTEGNSRVFNDISHRMLKIQNVTIHVTIWRWRKLNDDLDTVYMSSLCRWLCKIRPYCLMRCGAMLVTNDSAELATSIFRVEEYERIIVPFHWRSGERCCFGYQGWSPVDTICTTSFNILKLCLLTAECICMFRMVLTINSDCFPKQH
jgi:hypothetical protein